MPSNLRTPILAALLALTFHAPAPAQTQDTPRPLIADYIHNGWDTLSRSMTSCKSVVDPKVTTPPVLYLPSGMATPPSVAAMQKECAVQVAHLPRPIAHMGDVSVAEIPREGLLYLPNPYVVPGGRFNEMYGWDSYFILLGLVQDGRISLAKGQVENFFFEIEHYGAVLNANRTYFFTRSQPPLLSSMIAEVYGKTQDKAWLARAYTFATRDYALWLTPAHRAGDTGLARYTDIGEGPVPEMADDSAYYPDVIRWLIAHPQANTRYLVDTPEASCDARASRVCAGAVVDGHRLSRAFYRGDRAMRESGFDTTFRFGAFSGSTDEFAPVCLNSLLYKYEMDMATFAATLGRPQDQALWNKRAVARKAAITQYLWHGESGLFEDYNFVHRTPSTYNYIATFYPLWAGLATPDQAAALRAHLALFEHEGGLAMSDTASGTQWDLPYGWAPTNYFAALGLAGYGFAPDAARIAQEFTHTVETNYVADGTIREKYNVVSGSANIAVAAGYKTNVIGFGWTNGVYGRLHALLANPEAQAPSAAQMSTPAAPTEPKAGILPPADLDKLIPPSVFFRGQSATVQLRNSGAIRFSDGMIVFATKVDTGGYATSVQERYQDYLVTEVPLRMGAGAEAKLLPPGAYGVGFLREGFLVMDIGGHTLFTVPTATDATMRRPTPLQLLAAPTGQGYRLYTGRTYIDLTRAESTKP